MHLEGGLYWGGGGYSQIHCCGLQVNGLIGGSLQYSTKLESTFCLQIHWRGGSFKVQVTLAKTWKWKCINFYYTNSQISNIPVNHSFFCCYEFVHVYIKKRNKRFTWLRSKFTKLFLFRYQNSFLKFSMIIYNLYQYMIVSFAVMNLYLYIFKKKVHMTYQNYFFKIFCDNL